MVSYLQTGFIIKRKALRIWQRTLNGSLFEKYSLNIIWEAAHKRKDWRLPHWLQTKRSTSCFHFVILISLFIPGHAMAMPGSVCQENFSWNITWKKKKNHNSLKEILIIQRAKRKPFNKRYKERFLTHLCICVQRKGTQKYFQLDVKAFYKVIMLSQAWLITQETENLDARTCLNNPIRDKSRWGFLGQSYRKTN